MKITYMKKTIYIFFILISFSNFSFSQIGGISASKLMTLCTNPVAPKTIEFEPSFTINSNLKVWDDNHQLCNYSGQVTDNSFGFRFTYGIIDNLETGISIPVDVSSIQWGAKYRLINKNVFSFALISGINMDFQSNSGNTKIGMGGVSSFQFSDNFSTDLDIQFMKNFSNQGLINQIFIDLDNGLYIGQVQYIIGINYIQKQLNTEIISNNLYLNPGVTIEPANNFLMVLSFPFSVYGKNDIKTIGFSFALTITIN